MVKLKEEGKLKAAPKATKQSSLNERKMEIAHDREISTEQLLLYDIVPPPTVFDASGLMTKPEKAEFIKELESQHLVKYIYPPSHPRLILPPLISWQI